MAKFSAAAAVFFLLFTLTLARAPLKTLGKDDATTSGSESLPLADDSSVIRLPTAEILNAGENNQPIEPDSLIIHSVPLDLATARFRPNNRRHHYHLNPEDFFQMNSMEKKDRLEIPYGNDMIYSTGENSDFEEPPSFHGVRRIPGRWVRLEHERENENDDENNEVTRVVLKHKNVDVLNGEKNWKKYFHGENEKVKETKSGGLMKSMRKFLDRYF